MHALLLFIVILDSKDRSSPNYRNGLNMARMNVEPSFE